MTHIWDKKIQKRMRYRLVQKRHILYRTQKPNYQNISWKKMFYEKFEMKKCKNGWVMSSWPLTALEVTSSVSELGLSQNLRQKIIVSNTQIFHQIIKIWHEIRHLEKIWDQQIQKWLRYWLINKKPKFCCTYHIALKNQIFHQIIKIYHVSRCFMKIWDEKMQKRLSYVQLIFDCHGGNIYCQWTWT